MFFDVHSVHSHHEEITRTRPVRTTAMDLCHRSSLSIAPVATLASTGRDVVDAEDGASVKRADLDDFRVGISRRARDRT